MRTSWASQSISTTGEHVGRGARDSEVSGCADADRRGKLFRDRERECTPQCSQIVQQCYRDAGTVPGVGNISRAFYEWRPKVEILLTHAGCLQTARRRLCLILLPDYLVDKLKKALEDVTRFRWPTTISASIYQD